MLEITSITVKDASGDLIPVAVGKNSAGASLELMLVSDGETGLPISPATETTLAAIATELGQKLEAGQAVALDAGTLAALEQVTVTPISAGDGARALIDGRKTVTAPGTAVALRASSLPCKWVCVTALTSNTGQVNVGGSDVLATSGGSTGSPLAAGQSITIPVDDAVKVFVDARVAGEGVSFTAGT